MRSTGHAGRAPIRISYFLNITYMPTYLFEESGFADAGALGLDTIAAGPAIMVTPLYGLLADRIGRKLSLAILVGGLVVTTIPVYALLRSPTAGLSMSAAAFLAVLAAGWSAVAASTIPEQFTAVGHFSGMAIGYNIATALIAPTGLSLAPAIYATIIIAACGIPALLLMRNLSHARIDDLDRDELLVGVES